MGVINLTGALLVGCSPKIEISQNITSVEVGQSIDYSNILSADKEADINLISEPIDLNKVGSYSLTYSIIYAGKTIEKTCNIDVVDTTAPTLIRNKKSIDYGSEIDLLDKELVSVKDDGDTNPTISVIEGSIDTNISGEYTVVYEVSDCYGNKEINEVIYTVQNKKYTTEELTEYAKTYCDNLISDGHDITYEIDDFGTGICI